MLADSASTQAAHAGEVGDRARRHAGAEVMGAVALELEQIAQHARAELVGSLATHDTTTAGPRPLAARDRRRALRSRCPAPRWSSGRFACQSSPARRIAGASIHVDLRAEVGLRELVDHAPARPALHPAPPRNKPGPRRSGRERDLLRLRLHARAQESSPRRWRRARAGIPRRAARAAPPCRRADRSWEPCGSRASAPPAR